MLLRTSGFDGLLEENESVAESKAGTLGREAYQPEETQKAMKNCRVITVTT